MGQPSMETKKITIKPSMSRHVTVRSPSEEEFYEGNFATGHRRAPKHYANTYRSSSEEEEKEENHKISETHDQQKPVAHGVNAPPGIQPFNAPAGSTPQNGVNQVYIHGYTTQPGYFPGQQVINTPYPYSINYTGLPAPIIHANGATMDPYQNSATANNGLNFHPQVPDTSLGPMTHNYRPNGDGIIHVTQPGIAVCHPLPAYLVFLPHSIRISKLQYQASRPITLAQAPLVALPIVVLAMAVSPTLMASAIVYTTLGHMGDVVIDRPRKVAMRCVSALLQTRFHFFRAAFTYRTDMLTRSGSQVPQGVAVPFQAGPATAPIMPVVAQQAYQPQPMMIPGGVQAAQPVMMAAPGGFGGVGGVPPGGQPVFVNGGPAPMMMMPGNNNRVFPPVHNEPATGIGETPSQVAAAYMTNPELNQPQDFKPADDTLSRMYMVRQLDGTYVQMPRITIDSFGKDVRWYLTDDGVFYAVRLEP